ncbi:MAG: fibronectin type III domain-containing protein [Acidobacteriia bacterium]|nr:fibronectin type III domain-containing protein [Terriglobia bacterium]
MRQGSCWAAAALFMLAGPGRSQSPNACDLNQDGSVTKADVDLAVTMALGLAPCTSTILGAGVCNVVVVQRVANAALGGVCATGLAHSATLGWTASTSSGVTGYNVYRGLASGGPYTKMNPSLITGVTFTDANVQAGQTYYYVATAVDSSNAESGYSNQVTALVPNP